MDEVRVNGLRGVELAVFDLKQSLEFYRKAWGLEEANAEGSSAWLRGTGREHHILSLHQRPRAGLVAMNFSACDKRTVDALHAKASALGVKLTAPQALAGAAGGGYGFAIQTPDGVTMNVSADVAVNVDDTTDRSRPTKLSHIVLNSQDVETQTRFFCDVLGFRLSDATERMDFVRCSTSHHSIATAKSTGAGLNHMAYEVPNFDGLMRGAGRMKQSGYNIEWGVGRHGPGNNIFTYFVEPNGFVTEYTTEIEDIDEATHMPGTPEYWAKKMPMPDRWGMAIPSKLLREAMSGDIVKQNNQRCEDVISRKLAS
jgi:catechol-2,3-dioxygenase